MINIIHTNDIHSNILKSVDLFEYIQRERKKNSLIIDLGDFFQGTAFYNYFKGKPERKLLLNTYDIVIPGNHGFNEYLKINCIKKKRTRILCCNIFYEKKMVFEKYYEITISGIKLGFIGIMSVDSFNSIEMETRKNYSVEEPVNTLEKIIKDIDNQVDVLFILSHSGFINDVSLANSIKGVNFILSGHCHSLCYEMIVNNIVIKKAAELGEGLGFIKLFKNKYHLGSKKFVNKSKKFRNKHLLFLNSYFDLYHTRSNEKVAILTEKEIVVFANRANLMKYFMGLIAEDYVSDIYLFNITCIRSGILNHNLSLGDLYNILPFNNNIIQFKMNKVDFYTYLDLIPLEIKQHLLTLDYTNSQSSQITIITTSYLYENYFTLISTRNSYKLLSPFRNLIRKKLMNKKNDCKTPIA